MEMMTCQIAQTKRKCSSDELLNGSNNKEIIILKKISLVVLCEMVHLNYKRFGKMRSCPLVDVTLTKSNTVLNVFLSYF